MHDFIRLLLLLGIVASAATLIGAGIAFWMDEQRRLARIAWRVLGGQPDGLIIAQGRDAAAAFRIAADKILVLRDGGANALLYRLSALTGAELAVDDEIVARVARGEPRRALDRTPKDAQQVVLALLFDDPRHPEFALDLWLPMDEFRRHARPPQVMIQEARTWLSRAEAIMRRASPPVQRVSDAIAERAGLIETPQVPLSEAPRVQDSAPEPAWARDPAEDQDEAPFDLDEPRAIAEPAQPPAPVTLTEAKTKQLPLL
jgi:hypothetical protein